MRLLTKLILNVFICGTALTFVAEGSPQVLNPSTGTNTSVETNWSTYTYPESGFSVQLPKVPDHVHQKINIPKTDLEIEYDTYVSEPSDSAVYVISVWHYPAQVDMSKPEVNLQDGFSGMVSALPGSQILNMKMTEVQGFKALEFLVKNDDIFFQGRLILVYNTLYQVFTVYKQTEDMTNNYIQFVDSFQLISPEKNKLPPATPPAPTKSAKMNV